ncbi:MAG: hypothetical protein GY795_18630 [Desulfobacterales bacterium]|nr:hypothetical protein [Desulfobacterales bacterium]
MTLLENGHLLHAHTGTYKVVRPLGIAGAMAEVYEVVRETDQKHFAFKLMIKPEMKINFQSEMRTLQRLGRDKELPGFYHIPRLIESSLRTELKTKNLVEKLNTDFILMELARGVTVDKLIEDSGKLEEQEAMEISLQFAEVIYTVHKCKYTYKDMKLENLFWDWESKNLTVIDWNVVGENLEQEAYTDRQKAASYLFHMVTGIQPKLSDNTEEGVSLTDQDYFRMEVFKELSEGTRSILIRIFQPNSDLKFGNAEEQLKHTRNYMDHLKEHFERFNLPTTELLARGDYSVKNNQWNQALYDFDIVEKYRLTDLKEEQQDVFYKKINNVKTEFAKLGRRNYIGGEIRFKKGVYDEALDYFEKAMKDDPFDKEARLSAIITRVAISLSSTGLKEFQNTLTEYRDAVKDGYWDIASDLLTRVHEKVPETEALISEINVRRALEDGRAYLRKEDLKQAKISFRESFQYEENILYPDYFKKCHGSLSDHYKLSEKLKKHYENGKDCLEKENYVEASKEFRNAWESFPKNKNAEIKFRMALDLLNIQKELDAEEFEKGLILYERTDEQYGTYLDLKAFLKRLKEKIIRIYRDHLFKEADEFHVKSNFIQEQRLLEDILKLMPDDKRAKDRLSSIEDEITRGYRKKLEVLRQSLDEKQDVNCCREVIKEVKEMGAEETPDGKSLISYAEELMDRINNKDKRLTISSLEKGLKNHLSVNKCKETIQLLEKSDLISLDDGKSLKRFAEESREKILDLEFEVGTTTNSLKDLEIKLKALQIAVKENLYIGEVHSDKKFEEYNKLFNDAKNSFIESRNQFLRLESVSTNDCRERIKKIQENNWGYLSDGNKFLQRLEKLVKCIEEAENQIQEQINIQGINNTTLNMLKKPAEEGWTLVINGYKKNACLLREEFEKELSEYNEKLSELEIRFNREKNRKVCEEIIRFIDNKNQYITDKGKNLKLRAEEYIDTLSQIDDDLKQIAEDIFCYKDYNSALKSSQNLLQNEGRELVKNINALMKIDNQKKILKRELERLDFIREPRDYISRKNDLIQLECKKYEILKNLSFSENYDLPEEPDWESFFSQVNSFWKTLVEESHKFIIGNINTLKKNHANMNKMITYIWNLPDKWSEYKKECEIFLAELEKLIFLMEKEAWNDIDSVLEELLTIVQNREAQKILSDAKASGPYTIQHDYINLRDKLDTNLNSPVIFWLENYLNLELDYNNLLNLINKAPYKAEGKIREFKNDDYKMKLEKALELRLNCMKFQQSYNDIFLWDLINKNPKKAKEQIERITDVDYQNMLKGALDLKERCMTFQQNNNKPVITTENFSGLIKFFEQGEELYHQLKIVPRIMKTDWYKEWNTFYEPLREEYINEKDRKINELMSKIEYNRDQLRKSLQGASEIVSIIEIEKNIRDDLRQLSKIDKEQPKIIEDLINSDLTEIFADYKNNIFKEEQQKIFSEIQRRIVYDYYEAKNKEDFDYGIKNYETKFDELFEKLTQNKPELKQIDKLKQRCMEEYAGVSREIEALKKTSGTDKTESSSQKLENLLELRYKYGEYPELVEAIKAEEDNIMKQEQENKLETFRRNNIKFNKPSEKEYELEYLEKLLSDLDNIDDTYLKKKDQNDYHERRKILINSIILKKEVKEDIVQNFIRNYKSEEVQNWQEALEWAVENNKEVLQDNLKTIIGRIAGIDFNNDKWLRISWLVRILNKIESTKTKSKDNWWVQIKKRFKSTKTKSKDNEK